VEHPFLHRFHGPEGCRHSAREKPAWDVCTAQAFCGDLPPVPAVIDPQELAQVIGAQPDEFFGSHFIVWTWDGFADWFHRCLNAGTVVDFGTGRNWAGCGLAAVRSDAASPPTPPTPATLPDIPINKKNFDSEIWLVWLLWLLWMPWSGRRSGSRHHRCPTCHLQMRGVEIRVPSS